MLHPRQGHEQREPGPGNSSSGVESHQSKHGVFINGKKIYDETTLADDDQILIGETNLLFTDKDFTDRESALSHYKKVGERRRTTQID